MAQHSNHIRRSLGSRVFDTFNYTLLILIGIITLYPFWDALVVSFSSLKSYLASTIHLWPLEWSFEPYLYMFGEKTLWTSYRNTIFITVAGTALSLTITTMAGYVLSKTFLKGNRAIMFMIVFTMMFSGGVIPTYLVVKNIGLTNTLWSMIFPGCLSTYNLILMKNYFTALPRSLEESAMIDGANEMQVLWSIVLPTSLPVITTIALFYAVAYWNEFFAAVLYISKRNLWPLQSYLRTLLFQDDVAYNAGGTSSFLLGQPMKMAAIMMAIIPVMIGYPFFQKYFTQGVMLGAVKG